MLKMFDQLFLIKLKFKLQKYNTIPEHQFGNMLLSNSFIECHQENHLKVKDIAGQFYSIQLGLMAFSYGAPQVLRSITIIPWYISKAACKSLQFREIKCARVQNTWRGSNHILTLPLYHLEEHSGLI